MVLYFLAACTCKDALVLEARQEGQGIYTLGFFLAFLGRGPRALWNGNFIRVKLQIGKNSQMKMFLIFCKGGLKLYVVILFYINSL